MARLTGLEPATPGVTGRYSNQLSYNRASHTFGLDLAAVARLTGLEPATPGVTGRYSNQLSYNRPLLHAKPDAFRADTHAPPPRQAEVAAFCNKNSIISVAAVEVIKTLLKTQLKHGVFAA